MFKIKNSLFLFTLLSSVSYAEMVDSISVIFNETIISQSEVSRVRDSLLARLEIAPLLYLKLKDNNNDSISAKILIESLIIRETISKNGYVVSDGEIESRIKNTEQGLGLNRTELIEFLTSKGITFDEYFELVKQLIENSIFNSKIITPLISVTDQEIKEEYLRKNKSNTSLSLKYDLIDFKIGQKVSAQSFRAAVKKYIATGVISEEFKNFSSEEIKEINEEFLSKEIIEALKSTSEGELSTQIFANSETHCFFVVKKSFAESESYLKAKELIKNELSFLKMDSIRAQWFESESKNHFIKNYIK